MSHAAKFAFQMGLILLVFIVLMTAMLGATLVMSAAILQPALKAAQETQNVSQEVLVSNIARALLRPVMQHGTMTMLSNLGSFLQLRA